MADDDRITLIDFQDLVWGFEIQDVMIAIPLEASSAARSRGIPGRLRDGRPWPEAEAETVAASAPPGT